MQSIVNIVKTSWLYAKSGFQIWRQWSSAIGFMLILVIGVAVAGIGYVSIISAAPPSSLPSAPDLTLEPTPEVLQAAIATQQAYIVTLEKQISGLEKEQNKTVDDTVDKVDQRIFVIGVVGLALSLLGFSSIISIHNEIRTKLSSIIDQQLYQLDPTMLPIYIQCGEDSKEQAHMEKVHRRLELSGLKNLKRYDDLSNKKQKRGVVIALVNSLEREGNFWSHFQGQKPEPTQVAFIIYAPDGYRVDDKNHQRELEDKFGKNSPTLDCYENLSLANTPTTVASAVLAVARGLRMNAPDEKLV